MNEIVLYGSVGASFWEEDYFTAAMVRNMLAERSGDLTVRINSGGGIATEGQAIYTMLKDYPGAVHIVVDGVAASAASLIAMAGDTITMRLGAWMLIHDPAQLFGDGRGTADDHREIAGFLDTIGEAYAQVYADRAGISSDMARQIMRAETVYLGEDAVRAGFATHFEELRKAAAAASFDYRIYAHAPQELRAASSRLGKCRDKMAIVAAIAGFPREPGEHPMPDPITPPAPAPTTPPQIAAPGTSSSMSAHQINKLHMIGQRLGVGSEVVVSAIEANTSFEAALDAVNGAWAAGDAGGPAQHGAPTSRILRDERETIRERASMALAAQFAPHLFSDEEIRAAQGISAKTVALDICHSHGLRYRNDQDAVRMASHSSSDFPLVLENALYNTVSRGVEQQMPALYLASSEQTNQDYRTSRIVTLSESGMPEEVSEGGEVRFTTMEEKGEERATLRDFAIGFNATNKAIVNDSASLNLFADISKKMIEGSVERFRQVLLAPIEANSGSGQTMSDGQPMFHSSHGNLASDGATLSITSLTEARLALRKMKGLKGALRPVEPWALVVPAELETAAQQVIAAIAATKSDDVNPFSGTLQIIVEPGLSDDAAWYLIGNPARYDGLTHAFLEGQRTPLIESRSGWNTLGMEFRLTWALDAKFVETSTWYRNPGA